MERSTETLNMRDEMLVIQNGPQPRSPPILSGSEFSMWKDTPHPTLILWLGNCSYPVAFWKNSGLVLLYLWLLASSS